MTTDTLPKEPVVPQRRVVCAAVMLNDRTIVCSPRHWDSITRQHPVVRNSQGFDDVVEGFVDQFGNFLDRAEAWILANEAKQIVRRCGGDEGCLYSENLY